MCGKDYLMVRRQHNLSFFFDKTSLIIYKIYEA